MRFVTRQPETQHLPHNIFSAIVILPIVRGRGLPCRARLFYTVAVGFSATNHPTDRNRSLAPII